MKGPSDEEESWSIQREKIIGLGERSLPQLGPAAVVEAHVAGAREPRRPEVGAHEPSPHDRGRRRDALLVPDVHRAGVGIASVGPRRPCHGGIEARGSDACNP